MRTGGRSLESIQLGYPQSPGGSIPRRPSRAAQIDSNWSLQAVGLVDDVEPAGREVLQLGGLAGGPGDGHEVGLLSLAQAEGQGELDRGEVALAEQDDNCGSVGVCVGMSAKSKWPMALSKKTLLRG